MLVSFFNSFAALALARGLAAPFGTGALAFLAAELGVFFMGVGRAVFFTGASHAFPFLPRTAFAFGPAFGLGDAFPLAFGLGVALLFAAVGTTRLKRH